MASPAKTDSTLTQLSRLRTEHIATHRILDLCQAPIVDAKGKPITLDMRAKDVWGKLLTLRARIREIEPLCDVKSGSPKPMDLDWTQEEELS